MKTTAYFKFEVVVCEPPSISSFCWVVLWDHPFLLRSSLMPSITSKRYAKYNGCVTDLFGSEAFKGAVDRDWEQAYQAGIKAVPTFVINGRTLVGAQPYAALKNLILQQPANL
jgi:hypothetical protein